MRRLNGRNTRADRNRAPRDHRGCVNNLKTTRSIAGIWARQSANRDAYRRQKHPELAGSPSRTYPRSCTAKNKSPPNSRTPNAWRATRRASIRRKGQSPPLITTAIASHHILSASCCSCAGQKQGSSGFARSQLCWCQNCACLWFWMPPIFKCVASDTCPSGLCARPRGSYATTAASWRARCWADRSQAAPKTESPRRRGPGPPMALLPPLLPPLHTQPRPGFPLRKHNPNKLLDAPARNPGARTYTNTPEKRGARQPHGQQSFLE